MLVAEDALKVVVPTAAAASVVQQQKKNRQHLTNVATLNVQAAWLGYLENAKFHCCVSWLIHVHSHPAQSTKATAILVDSFL